MLQGDNSSEVTLLPQELSKGHHQHVAFTLSGNSVGGCEIHFVSSNTAYLRWIFVNHDLTGKGIGSQCMAALQHWLYLQGIRRFDTDTALQNNVAQHFYEKIILPGKASPEAITGHNAKKTRQVSLSGLTISSRITERTGTRRRLHRCTAG